MRLDLKKINLKVMLQRRFSHLRRCNLRFNKPDCILLSENNRLERELDTHEKERSSYLRLEKDECLLTEESEVIGRQVIRNEGVYLEGNIEGVKVTLTADTRTVVSTRVLHKIPTVRRPKLEASRSLASADAKPLKEKGKATFNLQIGDFKLQKELFVAEIEDEILLVLDILMKGEKGPADIKLSEGVVLLNGFIYPCVQRGHSDSVRKVVSAENLIIPPKSEIIIDVLVERTDKDYFSDSQEFLIESIHKFIEKYPVPDG